jgi:ferric-dicitrate binding protein FerR (iron transport regulator)
MEKQEFLGVLDRYLAGQATPEEEQMVINYLDSFQSEPGEIPATDIARERVLLQVQELLPASGKKVLHMKWWYKVAAAAVIAVAVTAGAYLLLQQDNKQLATVAQVQDIAPGYDRAVLTLADGSVVPLDSTGNQQITQGGTILQQQGGHLAYRGNGGKLAFNRLTTPRGGQFSLTLSDGTRVWLNAASAIRYPLAFNDGSRSVEVSGEAYFEVAADASRPFVVKVAPGIAINVLGTSFNINAYENEGAVKTTLLNGAVRVTSSVTAQLLKPGQQAEISSAGAVRLKTDVAVEKAVAWKNGYFDFDGMKLPEVMRQLERWYDITVIYQQGVPDLEFYGELTRNMTLHEMVKALGASGLKVRIEGKRMFVIK